MNALYVGYTHKISYKMFHKSFGRYVDNYFRTCHDALNLHLEALRNNPKVDKNSIRVEELK